MILFGLEICLDHAQAYSNAPQTGVTGRLAINGDAVNIQLVPSCGMRLKESPLALAPKDGPKTHKTAMKLRTAAPGSGGKGRISRRSLWTSGGKCGIKEPLNKSPRGLGGQCSACCRPESLKYT